MKKVSNLFKTSFRIRHISCLIFSFLISVAFSQTGGPGQPEFMQFQQAGTDGLVNPSTGTFAYQIPLFTIGGYPMNLTYQSGIQMEDVASMTGLGWNLNAGSIVRTLRGLPDDFNGDVITKEFSVKDNTTFGGKIGADVEITGFSDVIGVNLGAELGVFYNNYKGWGMEPSLQGSISASFSSNNGVGGSASLGMGVTANSQSGVDKYISPNIGLQLGVGHDKMGLSLGKTISVNSSEGLKINTNIGLSYTKYDIAENAKGKIVEKGIEKSNGANTNTLSGTSFSRRSFLNNSYNPDIDYPFKNISGSYSGTVGLDYWFVDPNFRLTGYFSKQELEVKSQTFNAYGLMYENDECFIESAKILMDFNREKKLPYYFGESKILPVPFKTPDVFNLSAQGLSLSFSVNKNDIGIVGDPEIKVKNNGSQDGAEVNFGGNFKAGVNIGVSTSRQSSGRWSDDSLMFKFDKDQSVYGDQLYRQFNLKNNGENNLFQNSLFDKLTNYKPITASTCQDAENVSLPHLYNDNSTKNKMQTMSQTAISYLTAKEASEIGFDKKIKYYTFGSQNPITPIGRNTDYRKDSHLSEISVTQPDGMRYVFGIPVYNTEQKEVTFNVSGQTIVPENNLVSYDGSDNSTGNTRGTDNYFESTTTPAYVTQFLITAVLSPDYRDITKDGITEDDLGNYVKFSYFKEDFSYKWRTPFEEKKATYNRGLRSDDKDNKGSYVYGEKELWYIRSMESRTEIAFFYYSNRNDGLGVKGEDGGINTVNCLRKLDSLKVYSKPDYNINAANATPIKSIYFDYSYKLCNGVNNNLKAGQLVKETGKLTLDKLSTTYENSKKGLLTPYTFSYGKKPDGKIVNPGYNMRDVNRWGYYQKNPADGYSDLDDNSEISNIDFPYASQERGTMDNNAYAWNLTNVKIPGGGEIAVEYEAHDYAYLQDKAPGQMFKLAGIKDINSTYLYDSVVPSQYYNRIFFNLIEPLNDETVFRDKYIKDIENKYLYYKFYVQLKDNKYEYITGYAKIGASGLFDTKHGYIDLKPAIIDDELDNGKCNPILKTAIQFMRINRGELIFPQPNDPADLNGFIEALPTVYDALSEQIAADATGINNYCFEKGYCQKVDLKKSFIRLYNPDKSKIAGGARVKRISIDDRWGLMAGGHHQSKAYTTSYSYTREEQNTVIDTSLTIISSGVADYEPMLGGDEISLKYPIFYSDVKKLAPDNEFYVEEPINESLFPSPQITYSKVSQVTNDDAQNNVSKTGKVVSEFYTAKDYPVRVSRTEVKEKRVPPSKWAVNIPWIPSIKQKDYSVVAQGYSILLNNMSGMPKATWVYDEKGIRISGEEYDYFLNNDSLTTIDSKGKICRNSPMGLSIEYTVDGKESFSHSQNYILSANLNFSMLGTFPLATIVPLYTQTSEEIQFRSLVINKVIHRNGILKRKTVHSQTASVSTENLAFDQVTGEALLTKTTNEFNDSLFSFNYPAWWMYEGMGPAYVNSKMSVTVQNLNDIKQFLKEGDELRNVTTGKSYWVNNLGGFINDIGITFSLPSNDTLKVYYSGAKNLLSASAGKVATWNYNPIGNKTEIDFEKILNSSATEYFDEGVNYCKYSCKSDGSTYFYKQYNDFVCGRKSNWKPKKSWFYLTDRTAGDFSADKTNIRSEGIFRDYTDDFWNPPAGNNSKWTSSVNNSKWEWKDKVNLVDANGVIIETEDRIERKTATLLAYNETLVSSQTVNAGYNEVFFDGFEEDIPNCKYDGQILASNHSHTGKYSIKVNSDKIRYYGQGGDPGVCGDYKYFKPENNKKYIFSCWVKVDKSPPILSCAEASVIITHGSNHTTLKPSGSVIEGWQRVEGEFKTDSNESNLFFVLHKGGQNDTYYDDIRIFPADANMVSYVYDDIKLRNTYKLDENNYFTKYEYNNQGELIRIKKETEKGIITIQESNHALIKGGK